jgi:hypothetical protein
MTCYMINSDIKLVASPCVQTNSMKNCTVEVIAS